LFFYKKNKNKNELNKDWEFIHISEKHRRVYKIKSYFYCFLVGICCFGTLWWINGKQSKMQEKFQLSMSKGIYDSNQEMKIKIISYATSALIVLFNKFALGKIMHYLVDMQKLPTKSEFNIVFG
jgi:hypothetical protein